ncbi:MAG TPA: DUF1648 domain-containing protein, partial [Polyangiales bacterium]|nr:DUF1648 domain-containing protein [Polyangiales bacterium]
MAYRAVLGARAAILRHSFGMGNQANTQRIQRVILLGVGLFAGWSVSSAWPQLPPRVASHFNGRGQPDGFMPREAFFTDLALIGGGLIVLLLLAPALLRLLPNNLINMPHRDYWLAPERRSESFGYIAIWFGWFAIATSVLLVAMLNLTLRANIAGTGLNAVAA